MYVSFMRPMYTFRCQRQSKKVKRIEHVRVETKDAFMYRYNWTTGVLYKTTSNIYLQEGHNLLKVRNYSDKTHTVWPLPEN